MEIETFVRCLKFRMSRQVTREDEGMEEGVETDFQEIEKLQEHVRKIIHILKSQIDSKIKQEP